MTEPGPAGSLAADLRGRVAIVTGGSRGLGREIARGLAIAGADVVIASRRLESCEAAAAEIAAESGRRVVPIACHVGCWDDVQRLAETTIDSFGRIDALVNNAGMSPRYERLGSISEELWDKVFDVNLKGPFRLALLVGEQMIASGRGGSIVNIGSAAATHPTADVVPYAAAKAGLNAVTVALARALGPTVRVNCVAPGTFFTDVSKHWDMEEFARRAEAFALRRGGQPSEIVGAVLYLVGDASSYTTGAVIPVDGGYA